MKINVDTFKANVWYSASFNVRVFRPFLELELVSLIPSNSFSFLLRKFRAINILAINNWLGWINLATKHEKCFWIWKIFDPIYLKPSLALLRFGVCSKGRKKKCIQKFQPLKFIASDFFAIKIYRKTETHSSRIFSFSQTGTAAAQKNNILIPRKKSFLFRYRIEPLNSQIFMFFSRSAFEYI